MTSIIGPFLGPGNPGEIRIFIALPFRKDISKLTCQIKNKNSVIQKKEASPLDNDYRVFSFEFSNLDPNGKYYYQFLIGDRPLDLEGGLKYEDCHFRPCSDLGDSDSFILLSCHNPFEIEKGSADDGWTMWESLYKKVKTDPSIKLLLLAGDQLYNDDVEREFIGKLNNLKGNDSILLELRNRIIEQYFKFWGDVRYRRVLAQIPSLAIWDDHDITDGWGSRSESFKGAGFKKNWQLYFDEAHNAFSHYQGIRNKNPLTGAPSNVFTNYYDWGDVRFYLIDLRTERHLKSKQIWTQAHRDTFFESLKNIEQCTKTIFFVTPVIPLRTNFDGDRRLTNTAKVFFKLRESIVRPISNSKFALPLIYGLWLISLVCLFVIPSLFIKLVCLITLVITGFLIILNLLAKIPEMPDISDDLNDGLSSDYNRKSLIEILENLFSWIRQGERRMVLILSGDIHVGGITEIVEDSGNDNDIVTILQVVSSPISNKPMPKVVEGITTTTSEMVLTSDKDGRIFARNIFYRSKRNFVQIFPKRLSDKNGKPPVLFHFEGHSLPTAFYSKFV